MHISEKAIAGILMTVFPLHLSVPPPPTGGLGGTCRSGYMHATRLSMTNRSDSDTYFGKCIMKCRVKISLPFDYCRKRFIITQFEEEIYYEEIRK